MKYENLDSYKNKKERKRKERERENKNRINTFRDYKN